MDFMLDCNIPVIKPGIAYQDPILLTGSCFTEHIGNTLRDLKFKVLQNPNGILFDPASVAGSLLSWMDNRRYTEDDLFLLNELWQSWQHHSQFSGLDKQAVLNRINDQQQQAHDFLRNAKWLVITLGSSFSYRLSQEAPAEVNRIVNALAPASGIFNGAVANCHRAPGSWFHKHMMTIEDTMTAFDYCLHRLVAFNPSIQVILTVSPVRHIRDGVIDNNRSKARLIEVVHHLAGKHTGVHYFPAYELVIDVLRDYRFFDIDMVHPNYAATGFVLEKFTGHFVEPSARTLMEDVRKIVTARRHKAFQPATDAHKRFMKDQLARTEELAARYPFLDLAEELDWFSH